jgi:hypothetical protein
MMSTILWEPTVTTSAALFLIPSVFDDASGVGYSIAALVSSAAIVFWFRYRAVGRVAFIENPVLGFLDLSGGQATAELNSDREILSGLFPRILEGTSSPPKCHVLFIYCQIETDGSIRGSSLGLRELIRESGAPIVVVASESTPEQCIAASKRKGYGAANLVLTVHRKGDVFGRFFQKLFRAMKDGTSMPIAWVNLAPTIPGKDDPERPGTLFCIEAGQIAFR